MGGGGAGGRARDLKDGGEGGAADDGEKMEAHDEAEDAYPGGMKPLFRRNDSRRRSGGGGGGGGGGGFGLCGGRDVSPHGLAPLGPDGYVGRRYRP